MDFEFEHTVVLHVGTEVVAEIEVVANLERDDISYTVLDLRTLDGTPIEKRDGPYVENAIWHRMSLDLDNDPTVASRAAYVEMS